MFIDTNILFYADAYKQENVFEWLDLLYEKIHIHQIVLDEMLNPSVRTRVEKYIDSGRWHLFNPDDEAFLSEELYTIYEMYVKQIMQAFRELDEKKIQQGRRLKATSDLGEIHCIAAALLLSARIICSNDLDIQEVIDDQQLFVASFKEQEPDFKLEQDTLLDFCLYVCLNDITSQAKARKFFKAFQKDRLVEFDELLATLN